MPKGWGVLFWVIFVLLLCSMFNERSPVLQHHICKSCCIFQLVLLYCNKNFIILTLTVSSFERLHGLLICDYNINYKVPSRLLEPTMFANLDASLPLYLLNLLMTTEATSVNFCTVMICFLALHYCVWEIIVCAVWRGNVCLDNIYP